MYMALVEGSSVRYRTRHAGKGKSKDVRLWKSLDPGDSNGYRVLKRDELVCVCVYLPTETDVPYCPSTTLLIKSIKGTCS